MPLPRLSSIEGTSGRFGSAGVGMRGPGETKLEMDKRAVRDRINRLENEIEKIKKQREIKTRERARGNKFRVCLVGYTNAGKSTFLNALAKDSIYADDKLFATLDTTSRSIWLSYEVQIILTDTVGFISKLPHNLVDAFSATLEEAKDADLLLHIIDASNESYAEQIAVVEDVLKNIGAKAPMIKVYNKCDVSEKTFEDGISISAKKKIGIDELKAEIIKVLSN